MNKSVVLNVIDSLNVGGAERVSVNIANFLHSVEQIKSLVCVTRHTGPLQAVLNVDIPLLVLKRGKLIEFKALIRFVKFLRHYKVQIAHAHSTSLFFVSFAKILYPRLKIIWHVHLGSLVNENRFDFLYTIFSKFTSKILVVNQPLRDWAVTVLHNPSYKVIYFPNFVVHQATESVKELMLPGKKGCRIICVANLRPEKDHLTLIRAMKIVYSTFPNAELFLVGSGKDDQYHKQLMNEVEDNKLQDKIQFLGARNDVPDLLSACDIGVLCSKSEGFPLSLLEYGISGLPIVATRVGEIPSLIEDHTSGLLVDAESPLQLAAALISLLGDSELRYNLGESFQKVVMDNFTQEIIGKRLLSIYDQILNE